MVTSIGKYHNFEVRGGTAVVPFDISEQLIAEIRRVRDEVMPAYLRLGEPAKFALTNMRRQMDEAVRAIAMQDVRRCSVLLQALRCQVTPKANEA